MQADKRYYIQIVTEKDLGKETIYVHTDSLIDKARTKYTSTIIMKDNIVIPNNYNDCHYGFSYNSQMNYKRVGIATRLAQLTDASEIIIHGHGDVENNKINGVSPSVLAVFLTSMKLRANCRINITG